MLAGLPTADPTAQTVPSSLAQAQQLERRGRTLFDAGQFREAAYFLEQAVAAYQNQGNVVRQAVALGNLALTYQHLGGWDEANQAVSRSIALLLTTQPQDEINHVSVLAQTLEIQGSLWLTQGHAVQAFDSWQQAIGYYQQLHEQDKVILNRASQAQSLQNLGRYRRAIALLEETLDLPRDSAEAQENFYPALQALPNTRATAIALRVLGEALQVAGRFERANAVLQHSLAIAQQLQLPDDIASTQISLGNVTQRQGDADGALLLYQQAAAHSATQTQAQLNALKLLLNLQRWNEAERVADEIASQLNGLPPGRNGVYARITFAQCLFDLKAQRQTAVNEAIQVLQTAYDLARRAEDTQSESYALGELGRAYELTGQWAIAEDFTQKALQRAQSISQPDIVYRWQWQLGRLKTAQQQPEDAISAYELAVATLQTLRADVVKSNFSYQLAFRGNAEEPIYRELLSLLLKDTKPSQEKLKRSREVITSLQVAQLENFLQEPCAEATPEKTDDIVEQLAQTTAVFYPILLPDRLELIVKLPDEKDLRHYRSEVPLQQVTATIAQLQIDLEEEYTFDAVKARGQQIYEWIIKPVENTLLEKHIDTLVFALDSTLRGIPMAVLFDGNQYLVERYAVAIAPGLDVLDPKPLPRDQINVLAVGLTDPPQVTVNDQDLSANFAQLPNIKYELEAIAQSGIPVTPLSDDQFTQASFNRKINGAAFPVVHLATHGQFSSDPTNTFLLTSNGVIEVNALGELFQIRSQLRADVIELLILNACETAAGDTLATLGIAGAAVRAGARSTIASLWTLDDTSGVEFTRQFYQYLGKPTLSKAKALQATQKELLSNPQYQHPRYWATYVLVGNWL